MKNVGWLLLLVALVAARSGFQQWARASAAAKRARQAAEERRRPAENPNLPKVDTGYILGGFDASPSPSPSASPGPTAR